MDNLLEILLGTFTLGLPLWFAFLDQKVLPKLRWVDEGAPPPVWGRMVVVVGIGLVVLVALAAPFSDFHPTH